MLSRTRNAGSGKIVADNTAYKSSATQISQTAENTQYFLTVTISTKSGRNETEALLRPISDLGAVSEVRLRLPNPLDTNRNFGAHTHVKEFATAKQRLFFKPN